MTTENQQPEVARFYTRSRKFPRLIGRLHDGTKIPGGPYTVTQGVVFAVLLALALITRGLWGNVSILLYFPVAVAVAWGAAWLVGRLPATRRNVASLIYGVITAATSPVAGKYKDQPVKIAPPHFAGGTTMIRYASAPIEPRTPAPIEPSIQPAPEPIPAPAAIEHEPSAAPAERLPVSGVERLLAQARGANKE